MKLYIGNKNYSSWSLRPWILLRAFNVPFEEVKVNVSGKGVHGGLHGQYSPSGLVPCLYDEQTVVWDSLAIAEYVAESFPGMWPFDKAARALCRCVSAEMHSGFSDVRSNMPMNIKKRLSGTASKKEVQTNIDRIESIWSDCRRTHGAVHPDGERAPFLFGTFTVADAMFAPVVWRFFTYNHIPADAAARAYMAAMLEHPLMIEWEGGALAEDVVGAGDIGPIDHYDAGANELGGPDRPQGHNTRQAFIVALRAERR